MIGSTLRLTETRGVRSQPARPARLGQPQRAADHLGPACLAARPAAATPSATSDGGLARFREACGGEDIADELSENVHAPGMHADDPNQLGVEYNAGCRTIAEQVGAGDQGGRRNGRLARHACRLDGRLAFPGEQLMRLSMDLATGGAGVVLALGAACHPTPVGLPFLTPGMSAHDISVPHHVEKGR